jgi:arylsulfatase A-like enzyme
VRTRNLLLVGLAVSACFGTTPEPTPTPERSPERVGKRGKGKAAEARTPKPPVEKPALTDELRKAPNVLVIVLDTVRADRMSLYGYGKPTTPRIDAWARSKGLIFDRAIAPGVWTLPSHASLFTGLPVTTHGVDSDHKWLDSTHVTAAEALGAAGYDTYAFIANPHLSEDTNLLQGFERTEHPWSAKWRKRAVEHLRSKLIPEDASTAVSPKWEGAGGASNNKYLYKEAGPIAGEALLAWIAERTEQDRPFFAFVNFMETHLPRIPTRETRKLVMSEEEIARSLIVPQSTTTFHEWMVGVRTFDELDLAAIAGVYDASLIELDAAVGSLLDGLEAAGIAEDTVIVLTSDHGELLGEEHLLLHKYTVHGALSRVPLVISWPGHVEPGVRNEPVSLSDALPMAIELGGVPVSAAVKEALATRDTTKVEGVVTEFGEVADGSLRRMAKLHPSVDLKRFETTFQAIEDGEYKLVTASDGSRRLFDVRADPAETRAIDGDVERVGELEGKLEAWRKAVRAYVPTGEGPVGGKVDAELEEGLEALGYVE